MRYVEMTVEEAWKRCNKNQKVLVAVQDLEDENDDLNIFVKKSRNEYHEIFEGVKTAVSIQDDFMKQLRLFTEKQPIPHILPKGVQRIVLLRELE